MSDELYLDGNARQNLATFCQTWEEPEVHRLMDLAIDKNMIDRTEYPQTAEIEIRCVHMLADLWNAPPGSNPIGTSTVGSSEACMLAGMAAKWRWKARRKALGKPADKPNLVCGPVQVCWDKFCVYWEIEKREIPMRPGSYRMDAESMLGAVDENTIAVVPTLGVTYTGQYEYVEPMAAALDRLHEQTGLDIDIHVDGASGAFVAPFTAPAMAWDFRLPRVKSISTSGHKYGLAPVGVGWVLWRDVADLPSELVFSVPYLGGSVGTFGINFSRPAGQVIAQYYNFLRLGRAGYRRVHQACYDTARWLAREIAKLGPFEFICDGDPANSIPAVCFMIRAGAECPYTLYDLSDQLTRRGWQVPAFPLIRRGERHVRHADHDPPGGQSRYGRPVGQGFRTGDRAFRHASDQRSADPKGSPSTHPHLMRSHSRRGRRERFLVADGSNSPTTCLWFSRKGIDHV